MEILGLKTNLLNQNDYTNNQLTPDFIGSLITYPINYTHPKCLPCDGYVLKIADYEPLYSVIGTQFNDGTEAEDEFRIPDYNVTKRFLQPSSDGGIQINAGLPNITGGWNNVGVEPSCANVTGAFYNNPVGGTFFYHASGRGGSVGGFYLNASRSSSIYGNSTTVQPASHTVHLCIKYK